MRINKMDLERSVPEGKEPLVVERWFIQRLVRLQTECRSDDAAFWHHWIDGALDCNINGLESEGAGWTHLEAVQSYEEYRGCSRLIKRTITVEAEVVEQEVVAG